MSAVHGRKLGLALCEVLGLDANLVTDITLHAGLNEAASVEIWHYISPEDVAKVAAVLTKYRLVADE